MGHSRMFGDDDPKGGPNPSPRTTIVGGRPPDDTVSAFPVPTGIQRLLRLAAVDPRFRDRLVEQRAQVASAAGVELTVTETAVLAAIDARQLRDMIDRLPAPAAARRDFLRQTAATAVVLLGGAALGESLSSCSKQPADVSAPPSSTPPVEPSPGPFAQPPPDDPERPEYNPMQTEGGAAPDEPPPRPDHNHMAPGGVRPDYEPPPTPPADTRPTRGIRPDLPKPGGDGGTGDEW